MPKKTKRGTKRSRIMMLDGKYYRVEQLSRKELQAMRSEKAGEIVIRENTTIKLG